MRVMVLVKPGAGYEEGQLPEQRELEAMGAFNEEFGEVRDHSRWPRSAPERER